MNYGCVDVRRLHLGSFNHYFKPKKDDPDSQIITLNNYTRLNHPMSELVPTQYTVSQ